MTARRTFLAATLGALALVAIPTAGPASAALPPPRPLAPKWISLACAGGVHCTLKVASPSGGFFWVSFGAPNGTRLTSVRPSPALEGGCNRSAFGRIGPNGFVCLVAHKGQGGNFPDGPSFDLKPGEEWKPVEGGGAWKFDFVVDKSIAEDSWSSVCLWAFYFSDESCYSIRPGNVADSTEENDKYDLAVTVTPSRSSARASGDHYLFETGIQVRNRESAKRDSEATKLELHVSASTGVLRSRLAVAGPRAKCDASVCFVPQIKPGLAIRYTITLTGSGPPPKGEITLRVSIPCRTSDETSCANNVYPRSATAKPAVLTIEPVPAVPAAAPPSTAPAKAELQAIRARLKALLANTKWWKNTAGEVAAFVGLGSTLAPQLAPGAAAAGFIGVRLDRLGDDIDTDLDKLDDAIADSGAAPTRKTEATAGTLPRIVPGGDLTPQAATTLDTWSVEAVAAGTTLDRFTAALRRGPGAAAAQAGAAKAVAAAFDRLGVASAAVATAGVPAVGRAEIAAAQAGVARDGVSAPVLGIMRELGVTSQDIDRLGTILVRPPRAGFPETISDGRARADFKRVADAFRRFGGR